jgi:hypothetical protein
MVPQMPENFLRNFLIFTLGVGGTLCYLILKARWHGWMLVGAIFVSMYGISTVASQIDSVAFLAVRLPHGTIRAILVQGAIAAALVAALFSACWTTVLLLPNPLMPASVARSYFWETLGFSLVFGALAGWLLCFAAPELQVEPNLTARLAASKL